MKPIEGETCEQAWLAAAEYLVGVPSHDAHNVVVEIGRPAEHSPADLRIRAVVDGFLREKDSNPVVTVAETIFPAAEYLRAGPTGVYETYPEEIYPEIVGPHEWGRYAYRLVRWRGESAERPMINPLKDLIDKMSAQLKGSRMRAAYELSFSDSAIDLPLYDPSKDGSRVRGGPCLSHVSLKLGRTDSLYLTALYRSHYYTARALGNFIGLAALQAFVCEQVGLTPGPLVCVSTFAKLDAEDWTVTDAKAMVARARAAFETVEAVA
jgi:hypothetical protein